MQILLICEDQNFLGHIYYFEKSSGAWNSKSMAAGVEELDN